MSPLASRPFFVASSPGADRTRKGHERIPDALPASVPVMQAPPQSLPPNMQQSMQNAALIQKNKTNAQLQAMVQVCGTLQSISMVVLTLPQRASQLRSMGHTPQTSPELEKILKVLTQFQANMGVNPPDPQQSRSGT
jgi:hypothetical protein